MTEEQKEDIDKEEAQKKGGAQEEVETAETAESQAQATSKEEPTVSFDFEGQRYDLKKSDADYLMNLGASYLRYARGRGGTSGADEPKVEPKALPKPTDDPLKKELEEIKSELRGWREAFAQREAEDEQETLANQYLDELEQATAENEVFKELEKLDPDFLRDAKSQVLIRCYNDENLSIKSATEQVAKRISALLSKGRQGWIESKVKQGSRAEEGSGGRLMPTAKPLTGKDLDSGKVRKAAMQFVLESQQAS